MTRLPDGLSVVEGCMLSHNVICKTALGLTYRSYLKREAAKYIRSSRSCSMEEYIDAWCDGNRSYRYKKILSRLLKQFVYKIKSYKIIIKNSFHKTHHKKCKQSV